MTAAVRALAPTLARPGLAALLPALILTTAAACMSRPTNPPPDRDPSAPVKGAGADEPTDPAVARFAAVLNAQRERDACPPLTWDSEVAAVAALHSRDMVERGYFSHVSPDGVDPFDRLRAAGIGFVAAAENLAFGASTGDELFAQWMGSPGHRANMLGCRYTAQGVGRYGNHWTLVLVRRSR